MRPVWNDLWGLLVPRKLPHPSQMFAGAIPLAFANPPLAHRHRRRWEKTASRRCSSTPPVSISSAIVQKCSFFCKSVALIGCRWSGRAQEGGEGGCGK